MYVIVVVIPYYVAELLITSSPLGTSQVAVTTANRRPRRQNVDIKYGTFPLRNRLRCPLVFQDGRGEGKALEVAVTLTGLSSAYVREHGHMGCSSLAIATYLCSLPLLMAGGWITCTYVRT